MTPPALRNAPLVLIVRDGWGENPHPEHDAFNAVKLARTPCDDRLRREFPMTLIRTSGEDVGLPEGTMGNSEVGHQNIGAGRVVDQESVRITKAIRSGAFFENPVLVETIDRAREQGAAVHLMGICSDAGVHGLLAHLRALLELCRRRGAGRVFVHCFTDGRDTGPFTGVDYLREVEDYCRELGVGEVASVVGRYYAMDRDNRWERVELAYRCLTGLGAREAGVRLAPSAVEAARRYYENPTGPTQKGDEFIFPTIVAPSWEEAQRSRVRDGDSVIFYNYRGDRPRELVKAFVLPDFEGAVPPSPDTGRRGFDRGEKLELAFTTMTAYEEDLNPFVRVAFPKPPKMRNILGEYLSALGLAQLRCAETEKFPHVTFFFNDYRDEPFAGENRIIVQSPRVKTYDLQPEMSAPGVRDAVLERLGAADREPVMIVNFANPDMVGHTGSLEAAIKACQTVDQCVGAIVEKTLSLGGSLIVTADHGNAEQMWSPDTDSPHTAHTLYDVPLFVVGEAFGGARLREGGRLADIAPTLLAMLGLAQPAEMTGAPLLV